MHRFSEEQEAASILKPHAISGPGTGAAYRADSRVEPLDGSCTKRADGLLAESETGIL